MGYSPWDRKESDMTKHTCMEGLRCLTASLGHWVTHSPHHISWPSSPTPLRRDVRWQWNPQILYTLFSTSAGKKKKKQGDVKLQGFKSKHTHKPASLCQELTFHTIFLDERSKDWDS